MASTSRTKRPRIARTTPVAPVLPFLPLWFETEGRFNNWKSFERRPFEEGRPVRCSQLSKYRIEERFNSIGWGNLLNLPYPFYINLVRHFYCNLKVTGAGETMTLRSYVKGRVISVTLRQLGDILGISNEGPLHFIPRRGDLSQILGGEEEENMFPTIMKNFRGPVATLLETGLKPSARMISRILQYNGLPKGGSRTKITAFHAYMTYCVYTERPLNFPYIMMMQMEKVSSPTSNYVLPYGKLLTPLFLHFGVDVSDEIDGTPNSSLPIDRRTISSMTMPYESSQSSEEEDSGEEESDSGEDDATEEVAPAGESSVPPVESPSHAVAPIWFQEFAQNMYARQDGYDQQLSELRSEMRDQYTTLTRQLEDLALRYPPPPPPS